MGEKLMTSLVKLPPMVASFMDSAKKQELTLFSATDKLRKDKKLNTWFEDHQEDFANAWVLGFEVEGFSEKDSKLLNDIIDFAIQFEFCNYDTYHELDDDLILEHTQKDIQKLRTFLNYTLGGHE